MNKVISIEELFRDGKVAVLVSYGYGAGWSTWNTVHSDSLLFDPDIVQMVLDGASSTEIADFTVSKYYDEEETVYVGGADGLAVEWVPQGTRFMVSDNDGYETIVTEHDLPYIA